LFPIPTYGPKTPPLLGTTAFLSQTSKCHPLGEKRLPSSNLLSIDLHFTCQIRVHSGMPTISLSDIATASDDCVYRAQVKQVLEVLLS
jgi:hypothetical protein